MPRQFKKRTQMFFFLKETTEMFEVPQKCFCGKTALVSYLTEKLTKILLFYFERFYTDV